MTDFIQTFSGKRFHFLDPQEEELDISDIAHALSNICRYSGHVTEFYSVAEHCVILAEYVLNETADPKQALAALLHDASEAYLVDVPRPIKKYLSGYQQLEQNVTDVIKQKWGLVHSSVLKYSDTNIIKDESILLNGNLSWVNMYDELGVDLYLWTPEEAEEQFLNMFEILRNVNG